MYSFEENVFIVWGGNKDLADKVAQRMTNKGTRVHVGGDLIGDDDNSYLGPRVLQQMNASSRALVLAEPEADSSGRKRFRENLMFEWGYLLNRLPVGAISVYIIGADRSTLPSDLQGAVTQVVPGSLTRIPNIASWIVKKYRETYVELDDFVAFDLLQRWDKWKNFIDAQIELKAAPRPKLFRRVLLSAILPAMYNDDFDYLERALEKLDYVGDVDSEYMNVARVALQYLRTTRKFNVRYDPGTFNHIKQKISAIAGHSDPFLVAVTRHFMGLCLRNESMLTHGNADKKRHLVYSVEHFEIAEKIFEAIDMDDSTRNIWLAFVRGSLAKSLIGLGDADRSIELQRSALKSRMYVQQRLTSARLPRIYQNYLAETYTRSGFIDPQAPLAGTATAKRSIQ